MYKTKHYCALQVAFTSQGIIHHMTQTNSVWTKKDNVKIKHTPFRIIQEK